ncbi:MAG: FecR domain-containing protein [Alphaproteobacteria bacterium]
MVGWCWRVVVAGCALAAMQLAEPSNVRADDADVVSVQLKSGDSLRDVAERYLGDPDVWPVILALNGMEGVADVRTGTVLRLPVAAATAAEDAIKAALATLQQATEAGARLFAPAAITQAFSLHDQAVLRRKVGDYEVAGEMAERSRLVAADALTAATAKRDQAAEALLNDRQGWVEGQRPEDLVWSDRIRNAILIEQERVRTLSHSTAQITFRDDSRLRLNANSQAVIQRMRVDPLSRTEAAEVSLVDGDLYAILGGRSARKSFEIAVEDVDSDIRSTSFWISNDAEAAKFTNYDDRDLTVSAAGESVTLGRNEGTVIIKGEAPAPKADLLAPPPLVAPADGAEVSTLDVGFAWEPLVPAAGYWLEVAFDPEYRAMALSRFGLPQPGFVTEELEPGAYYWRVAALDSFGLPGARSPSRLVRFQPDVTPPFLRIERPVDEEILREASLRIEGTTEPGASLTLDGAPVAIGEDGTFSIRHQAETGTNGVEIVATDAAGNVTRRAKTFSVMPDARARIAFALSIPRRDQGHFLTGTDAITLSGTTRPSARLDVGRAHRRLVTAYADQAGAFSLNLPVAGADQAFDMTVTAPSGFQSDERIMVSVDREPPVITLDAPLPPVTSSSSLTLAGTVDEAATVTLNGLPIAQADRRFTAVLPLTSEQNRIELAAADQVGNVRLLRFDVRLDQTPPVLLGHQVTPDPVAAGQVFLLEVEASDPAGMQRTAAYTLEAGDGTQSGLLDLDASSSRYVARLVLERPASTPARLRDVVLEDYAGNRRRYMLE